MDGNGRSFSPDGVATHDPEIPNPEASIRAWIRLLALREESYRAARQRVLALFEDEYVHWLMQRSAGNRSKAARIAGVTRRTVYRLTAHQVDKPPADRTGPDPTHVGVGGVEPSLAGAKAHAARGPVP